MKKLQLFIVLLILTPFILVSTAIYSSGPDTPAPTPQTQPPVEPTPVQAPTPAFKTGAGEFFFRVRVRGHMHDAGTWFSEVRVHPAIGRWPGVHVSGNATHETSIRAILSIADVFVPPSNSDFSRWHAATEREESRYAESENHTWKLLSAAETCIIQNPVDIGGIIEGRIFVVIGGNRIDLGKALVHDGYASTEERDWGKR